MRYAAVAVALVGAVVAKDADPEPTPIAHWGTWASTTTPGCSYVTEIATSKCAPHDPNKCWPYKQTSTVYPEKCDGTWTTWEVPDDKTKTAKCSYVTEIATSKCIPGHKDQCWPYKKTSTIYPDNCDGHWNTWEVPEKTTTAKCSYVTDYPVTKCSPQDPKKCWVKHESKTVYPDNCDGHWNTWEVPEKTATAECSYVTEYPVTKCLPGHKDDKHCFVKTKTSTVYPDNCDGHWSTWEVPEKTTTAKCSYVTDYPVTKCDKHDDKKCWVKHETKTVYPDNCDGHWNTWEVPEVPDVTTTAKCSYVTEYPVTKCDKHDPKKCYVKTKTDTVYPTDCATWGVWESTVTVPADVTVTKEWNEWKSETPVVVTSVVKPGWEKDGWFGPEWPEVKEGQCATNVVTSYGYPIWVPAPEPTTVVKVVESTWAQWSETPVDKVAETTWAQWSETPVDKVAETTWATWGDAKPTDETPKPDVPKPGKPGKPGKAEHKPNGNKWAITYGPYDKAGKCKTVEVIKEDVKKIKELGFTTIRVYSTDCKTLEYVGDACREHGLKIIIGVFIAKSGIEGAKPQVKDIVAWAQWDIVELVVIGNEAVFQGFCKPDELVAFIKYCKAEFAACGYTGPCTTTEPLGEWEKSHDKFCGVVDVVSANLYAYFNADCTADKAGEFIQKQIVVLNGLCKNKETYVMECGWPSEGQCNGKACAGKKEQAVAIKGIEDTCGAKIVFFNYEDEHWKQPGQYGVEQHWGVYDVFSGKGDNWSTWGKW